MKGYEVQQLFGGITCPHCNKPIIVCENEEDLPKDFHYFETSDPNVKPECHQFDSALNDKFFALRAGNLSEADFQVWASQYRP